MLIRRSAFFIVFVLFIRSLAVSQPCLPDGTTFDTQEQIDNFQTNYPGCTEIEGSVWIGDFMNPSDITNLEGLSMINSIVGYLAIWGNNTLTNLSGLNELTLIGGSLSLGGGPSLSGPSVGNNSLTSLSGLENVNAASIENLHIVHNSSLSNCEVLSICDYLAAPNGTIYIGDNAPGCNSQEEVNEACITIVDEKNGPGNYSISPNPVKDKATFSSAEIISFELYDPMGALIANRNGNKIDMSNLDPGIYFVIGFDKQNNPLYKRKIIKK